MRALVDAIFNMAQTGCQWRLLPKELPPYTRVQRYFYSWRTNGVWPQLNHLFLMRSHQAEGRRASLSGGVIDSQSVKTTDLPIASIPRPNSGPPSHRSDAGPLKIVKRADAAKGFVLLPRRWVVERTLAWLNRNRRLTKNFEATIASAETWLWIASVKLMVPRLARA